MTAALRVALVGCGRIGMRTPDRLRETVPPGWIPVAHAEAVRSTPGLELVAACDQLPEVAQRAGQELGVTAFTDYRRMIERERPDIVSIATRTQGRCDIVEFAAAAKVRGLHIEKPLGSSPADCRRAMAALEKAGAVLTYGATRRWMEVFQQAKRRAEGGEIGALQQLTIEFGRAALLWTHAHSFDLIAWFGSGQGAASVQASCRIEPAAVQGRTIDADPLVEGALVGFEAGLNAAITGAGGLTVRLSGERGTLAIEADGARLVRLQRAHADRPSYGEAERIPFAPRLSGTQGAFAALRDAVHGKGPTGTSPAQVMLANLLGFACAWSSLQGGRRVTLDEIPEDLTITGRQGGNYA